MATNNFKSFATGAGANVTSQADYEALSALLAGFQAGKASSAQINKALRQSSSMSAMLGQFIGAAGLDALDNGNIATLLSSFTAALTTNLSLGTASKRNVGTGANQMPDMSFFSANISQSGYQKLPSGLIIQWRGVSIAAAPAGTMSTVNASLPITFPNAALAVVCSLSNVTTYSTSSDAGGFVSAYFPDAGTVRVGSGYTKSNSSVTILAVGY